MLPPSVLLEFERTNPGHPPGKETAIRHELGIGPARYYQLLIRAARSVEGMEADALTARRVRDMVGRRRRRAA